MNEESNSWHYYALSMQGQLAFDRCDSDPAE